LTLDYLERREASLKNLQEPEKESSESESDKEVPVPEYTRARSLEKVRIIKSAKKNQRE
jgi:hypothetical protein